METNVWRLGKWVTQRPKPAVCPGAFILSHTQIWQWVKNRYPKWNPGKWKEGLKPAVPRRLHFEPYPFEEMLSTKLVWGSVPLLKSTTGGKAKRCPSSQIWRTKMRSTHLGPGDVPLKVINDGEVTALAAVQKIKARSPPPKKIAASGPGAL